MGIINHVRGVAIMSRASGHLCMDIDSVQIVLFGMTM